MPTSPCTTAAAQGRDRERARALRVRARRIPCLGVRVRRRSGCCGAGCGWCFADLRRRQHRARRRAATDSARGATVQVPRRPLGRAAGRLRGGERCGAGRWRGGAGACSASWSATISRRRSSASSTPGSSAPTQRRRCRRAAAGTAERVADAAPSRSRDHRPVPRSGDAAMSVAIVDYGSGNLHSAAKAFERAARESGHDQPIVVTSDPDAVAPRRPRRAARRRRLRRLPARPRRRARHGRGAGRDASRSRAGRSSASASACS